MAKINLNDIVSGFNLSKINDNFQKIAAALNDRVLWRNNVEGEPNQLENDIDMNGKHIYNLPNAVLNHEPATKGQLDDVINSLDASKTIRVTDVVIPALPNAVERSNKYLSFDSSGNPVVDTTVASLPEFTERLEDVEGMLYPTTSVIQFMSTQDLLDVASGTESEGVRQAVIAAVARVNSIGGTLVFPPGHFKVPYLDPFVQSNWIEITKSGVKVVGSYGSTILENFLIYAHGGYGAPQLVGAAGFNTGSTSINSATPHNLLVDDYVQLLSGVNAYTPDGGIWQLGSQNPTTLATPNCRHAEIHRVSGIVSPTEATVYDTVIYAPYKNNTSGQSFPMPGVVGAEIRKLTPIVGFVVEGITFRNVNNTNFREILLRSAVDVEFVNCIFEAKTLPGAHIKTTDVFNIRFNNCTTYRKPAGASGSSWNSFAFGACTQNIEVVDCEFIGEQQTLDFTPNLLDTDIGSTASAIRADYLTSQVFSIENCTFNRCADGFTTHPGTYNLRAVGNIWEGSSFGIRVRSKKNTIVGNTFKTYNGAVTFSAFYDDTLLADNNIEQLPMDVSVPWVGVGFAPLSSEIMNNNNIQNVIIQGNTIKRVQANSNNLGIQFRHAGNGVPANVGFTQFTNSIKTSLSNYTIKDNVFIGCSIRTNRWVNGLHVIDNSFSGGSDITHYVYMDTNSARHFIDNNLFKDSLAISIFTDIANSPSFAYVTSHRIGYQTSYSGITANLTNTDYLFKTGFNMPLHDAVTLVHGGKLFAVRGSGAATLGLDATASDGVSPVDIRLFEGNPTSGNKTLIVNGRVTSNDSYPTLDNTFRSGIPAQRWSVVYAGTGTINTSDEREKLFLTIVEKEKEAARLIKQQISKFKFTDAVGLKGSEARLHFGVGAQTVKNILESVGLDPFSYAFLCYDEWDDDEEAGIKAGNRYGIRYDELAMFILLVS